MLNLKLNKFVLIDKPAGWTSFDAVAFLRRQARQQFPEQKNLRVGHAGTLDPFATGLLIVGIGRQATKQLDKIKNLAKTYQAIIRLGAVSDTDDPTGTLSVPNVALSATEKITKSQIENILKTFTGEQEQIPPMYSAKSIGGQRLYKLARQGKVIERPPSKIKIYKIKLLGFKWPDLSVEIKCSSGTYIRTLAHDIGLALGAGGYCLKLRRTKIGNYSVKRAQKIKSDGQI